MTLKEANKFVRRASGVSISIELVSLPFARAAALVNLEDPLANARIAVDKEWWISVRHSKTEPKAALLHEIGHLYGSAPIKGHLSMCEMFAQLWAIRRAQDLNLKDVRTKLIDEFKSWELIPWNSKGRRYRIARSLYKASNIRY